MDNILSKAAGSLEELAETPEFGRNAGQIEFVGHYIPFGTLSKLRVRYSHADNDYSEFELSVEEDGAMVTIEEGSGIDIPESILRLAKKVASPNRKLDGYRRPKSNAVMDIVFHMVYSSPINTPMSPERLLEAFYTIIFVTFDGVDDEDTKIVDEEGNITDEPNNSWIVPSKWWAEARIMTETLRVYNTLDFSTYPMQILGMGPEMFETFCNSNPLLRLVSHPQSIKLRAEGNTGANQYLFIPTDPFLRQRTNTWYYAR